MGGYMGYVTNFEKLKNPMIIDHVKRRASPEMRKDTRFMEQIC